MEHDNLEKHMFLTNKKQKIFNVRKVHYKQFDHQKYLKPTFSPFHVRQNAQQSSSVKSTKKGGQYNYQVAIISSPAYKELTKKYNLIKQQHSKQKQQRLQQFQSKQEQLNKCKAEKQRIDSQRIKIIQRRDQLRQKLQQIRQKNEILRAQQMRRHQQYRIMNMEYLRNMVMGVRYQNGQDIDIDNMTYQQLLQLQQQMGSVSKGLTEQQIQKLPKKLLKQDSTEQLCSICYYHAKQNQQMTTLPCNHSFHTDCIKEWLLKEKICPMCKQQIIMKIQSTKKLTVATNVGEDQNNLVKQEREQQEQIQKSQAQGKLNIVEQKHVQSIYDSDSVRQDMQELNMAQIYQEEQLIQTENTC